MPEAGTKEKEVKRAQTSHGELTRATRREPVSQFDFGPEKRQAMPMMTLEAKDIRCR
jgi:hypothetical protein